MGTRLAVVVGSAAVGAAAFGAAVWIARATAEDLSTPRDLTNVEHVTSSSCRPCHQEHHDSWHRTFHRTMTQEASETSVLGDFGDAELIYRGVTATMFRGDDGAFRIRFDGPGNPRTVDVVRTVGSHRYQQYLAREDDVYFRLPVAWHVEDGRWFHMNGAFLTPDPDTPIRRRDYDRHVVRWNDNCVFCHNVAANPGLDPDTERFDTEVAELGIACEACHGPGGAHARANRNPVRRYALHASDEADPTIVDPSRLSPARSAEVCGRCHGQRITADIGRFLRNGDPYVPGQPLHDYSRPLFRDTTLDGEAAFESRFWPDGTARLTAYEYQGLLQSACFTEGELTCTTCHGMHEGEPAGQIRPSHRGDEACIGCHADLSSITARTDHSGHPDSVECVTCHMPRVVYGLVDVHRSHRIDVPDPSASRPDACTLCHVGRSRQWMRERIHAIHEPDRVTINADTLDDTGRPLPLSEVERLVLSGDPIERAVAAHALGRRDVPPTEHRPARRLGFLLDAMNHDRYPAVRRIAWKSLLNFVEAENIGPDAYDPTGDDVARDDAVRRIIRDLPVAPLPIPAGVSSPLRAVADQRAIEIGE